VRLHESECALYVCVCVIGRGEKMERTLSKVARIGRLVGAFLFYRPKSIPMAGKSAIRRERA